MTVSRRSLDHSLVCIAALCTGTFVACLDEAPILTAENHRSDVESGWKRSDCFECHAWEECEQAGPYDREPDCVACHGFNGARDYYHLTDEDCYRAGCHAGSHDGQGFAVPLDCRACHYHGGY